LLKAANRVVDFLFGFAVSKGHVKGLLGGLLFIEGGVHLMAARSVNEPIGTKSFLTQQRASFIRKKPIGFLCLP